MGNPEKLEDARNDLGFIECRMSEIGHFDSPELDKLVDEAQGHIMEAKDALKEALIVLRMIYPWTEEDA